MLQHLDFRFQVFRFLGFICIASSLMTVLQSITSIKLFCKKYNVEVYRNYSNPFRYSLAKHLPEVNYRHLNFHCSRILPVDDSSREKGRFANFFNGNFELVLFIINYINLFTFLKLTKIPSQYYF